MDWIGMVQISLSIGTFGMLVYEVFYNSRQRKIDRRISVTVEDQREKQRKLFDNVTGLLDIEKKFIYSKITEDELSHVVVLQPENGYVEYYFMPTWELDWEPVADKTAFQKCVNEVLDRLNNPVNVKTKKK